MKTAKKRNSQNGDTKPSEGSAADELKSMLDVAAALQDAMKDGRQIRAKDLFAAMCNALTNVIKDKAVLNLIAQDAEREFGIVGFQQMLADALAAKADIQRDPV